ncbi:single-strand selective monofunctional uracil DNA glycosylase isoform X1 [Heterocephalus glaber]|uniref:Single-strand selective monofunctional uracil DNA glycosylase isoform X1 n=1 Tax=Heterocephalus glaber TaxID=10181 RepID=A0AAX6SCM8_HETGA|nr:single-strand selective monofunctional uracil DNA glycosylase isoform X1 [Heterocephalus glaber]XP_021106223.1 single-strand selective monofunctional uracil DNA glycosylase isoform X1 [Heterocephalus glaber]
MAVPQAFPVGPLPEPAGALMEAQPCAQNLAEGFLEEELRLNVELSQLHFSQPVGLIYNPVDYAWEPHRSYVTRYCQGPKEVLFLGMNPGPFGMAQTGVPFGEVSVVRDWLGIGGPVLTPAQEHPKRPVLGLQCPQSEIWNLFGNQLCPIFWCQNRNVEPFLDSHTAKQREAGKPPVRILFSSLGVITEKRVGLGRAGRRPRPASPDPNVHVMELSAQPRTPPSRGENPTTGEHLDQTTAMKAQHQTRVSEQPSQQALVQEKMQIFLLEAFKCHRTPEFGISPYSQETDVPSEDGWV